MSFIKKSLLIVLLLFGLFSAANLSSFLYSNESASNLTYQNFTKNGTSYSLVLISSNPTFLLVNGELSVNRSEIQSTVREYYLNNFYPNSSELDNLKNLIDRFNKSRNDGFNGTSFANKEEYVCRNEVLASNGRVTILGEPLVCKDQASCQRIAQMLFGVWNEAGLRLGSPTVIYDGLILFTPSSLAMDSLLSNFTTRLSSSNENNIYDNLEYIRSNADLLTGYTDKIEKTVFRTPRPNDQADRTACIGRCYGLCPAMDLDQALIPQIKNAAANISAKARFLKNYDLYSNLVFNETLNRISFSNNESAAKQYIAAFNSINSSSRELVRKNGQLLQLVDSPPLESTYNRYLSLSSSIPTQINSRNFTQIDSKLSEMQAASDDLVQLYQNISYSFELTKNASRDANKQILFLSSKDLDPSTSASLDLLKERVNSLNSRFGSKVPASSLGSMEANYSQLLNESTAILESDTEVPTSKATNLLRSLSKKTNYGLLDFISQTHMNVAPDNLFIILSVLLFLGFSSLFALIFFYSVLSLRAISSQFRQVMMFVFIAVMVGLLFFSTTSFVFFKKTSTDSNVAEYLSDFKSKNSVAIVVDGGSNVQVSPAMLSCAQMISNSLSSQNKSVWVYSLKSDSCSISSISGNSSDTLSACNSSISRSDSKIFLKADSSGALVDPMFSAIYDNHATYLGNAQYFNYCYPLNLYS